MFDHPTAVADPYRLAPDSTGGGFMRDVIPTRMSPSPIGCSSPSRSVQPLQGLRTLELEPWPVLCNGENPSAL
jgi:hypothetical protein